MSTLPLPSSRSSTAPAADAAYPASFAQQRLWFLDQLEPKSPFYNVPVVLRLAGALDAQVLERAFEAILRRHDGLRTVFPSERGRP